MVFRGKIAVKTTVCVYSDGVNAAIDEIGNVAKGAVKCAGIGF
jgi:hypothetical protein